MPAHPEPGAATRRRIRAAMRHLLTALGHPRGRRGLLHHFAQPPAPRRAQPATPA